MSIAVAAGIVGGIIVAIRRQNRMAEQQQALAELDAQAARQPVP
jgi:hypothetical protein